MVERYKVSYGFYGDEAEALFVIREEAMNFAEKTARNAKRVTVDDLEKGEEIGYWKYGERR